MCPKNGVLANHVLEDPAFQALSLAVNQNQYKILNVYSSSRTIVRRMFRLLGLATMLIYIPWQAIVVVVLAQVIMYLGFNKAGRRGWTVLNMETREGRRGNYFVSFLSIPIAVLSTKSLGLTDVFMKQWQKITDRLLTKRLELSRASNGAMSAGGLVTAGGFAVGLFVSLRAVLAKTLPVSSAVVFITSYRSFTSTVAEIADNIRVFQTDASVLSIIERFFTAKAEVDEGRLLPKESLSVVFDKVWFHYPGSKVDVLRGASFSFFEGEHIALVGLNGAGKSTILKLLMRVYEPTKGRILVNGIDLATMKPSVWRRALAMMMQTDSDFSDTLQNLVRYGDFAAPLDKERMEQALHVSGLKDIAGDMSSGLQTYVDKYFAMPEDKAIDLSGGQKQIVAIARTLYRRARIFVFDEPTASVDAEKEEHFFSALPETLPSQAVIFVSHRFSTLRRAERIVVLDSGRVIEDGTHEELLAKRGRYAEPFALQARSYQ